MKKKYNYLSIISISAIVFLNCGGSSSSKTGGGTEQTAPNAPVNISITAGNGNATICWDDITGADSYNIYYKTSAGVTTSDIKISVAVSPYLHSPLINWTTYYYRVTAVNSAGESSLSSEVSGMPTVPAPGVPANVSVSAGSRQTTVTWDEVPEADSYIIHYATYSNITGFSPQISNVTSPYVHTPLDNGTTYYYAVTAVDGGVESVFSGVVSATPEFNTTEMQKILASDPQMSDGFGVSVSISGDYAIVGAVGEDGGSGDPVSAAGAAYIFHRTGGSWDAGFKITASDAQTDDNFGCSVSINGDYAIVGADSEDGGTGSPMTSAGAAYIFHRTGTNTWDGGVKIIASDLQAGDLFGTSVSISGDYAVVGAYDEDGGAGDPVNDAGAAYVFHRTGANTWDPGVKLTASDAQASDFFGISVSISGDYIIVGAHYDDVLSSITITNAGSAYIFQRIDTNAWNIGTKITATDPQTQDRFGKSVSISGDYAVVGAFLEDGGSGDPIGNAGAAYVFHRTGSAWDSGVKIVSPQAQIDGDFGWSVSISGDYIVVGTMNAEGGPDHSLTDAGTAYLFHRTGVNAWDAGTQIFSSDIEALDGFGRSVSISGNYIIIGSPGEDEGDGGAGAAYLY